MVWGRSLTEREMRKRIGVLLDMQMDDRHIQKRVLIEFGIDPKICQDLLEELRARKVDLTPSQDIEDVIENEDERRFDADLGYALGLDWSNHD